MKNNYSFAILFTVIGSTAAINSVCGDSFGNGANAFTIDFVNIGNPGNVADITGNPNPAGSVGYEYRIGKYEVSQEMIDKANAVGHLGIVHDSNYYAGIVATRVSWNEAARFVNWLNTSTGSKPAYKFEFQPEQRGYDVNANILLWTSSDAGYDPNNLYRNTLARYFLPSIDEWYKAAYYDPASAIYYDYPTGSDSAPARSMVLQRLLVRPFTSSHLWPVSWMPAA